MGKTWESCVGRAAKRVRGARRFSFQCTPHEWSGRAAAHTRGGVGAVATIRLQVGPKAAGCGPLTPHYS